MFIVNSIIFGTGPEGVWVIAFDLQCQEGTRIWPRAQFAIPVANSTPLVSMTVNVTTFPDATVRARFQLRHGAGTFEGVMRQLEQSPCVANPRRARDAHDYEAR